MFFEQVTFKENGSNMLKACLLSTIVHNSMQAQRGFEAARSSGHDASTSKTESMYSTALVAR